MNYSLNYLEAFAAVAENGSFSAAARKLGKAQSRISTAVSNLEIDLGVDLFDRSSRYPVLTLEGERLLNEVREILLKCRSLSDHAQRLSGGEQALLRIAVDELMPARFMAEVLEDFPETFPDTDVEILWGAMGDVAKTVVSGRAEVGIDMPVEHHPPADCSWQVLGGAGFCAVVAPGHPLTRLKMVTPSDIKPHRQFVAVNRSGEREPEVFRFSNRFWQCEDSKLIRELVHRGMGWAWLARYQVAGDLERGDMVELPLHLGQDSMGGSFFFVWKKDHVLTPAEKWMADRSAAVLKTVTES